MTRRFRIPFLFAFLVALLPASTSPVSSNTRLAEILRLPKLQPSDWQALFSMAESGDPEAQYWLGLLYDRGQLLRQDKAKGSYWLEKSAAQGYPQAEYLLCGRKAQRDSIESERCLWRAAESDVPQAQFWLGVAFDRHVWFGVTDKIEALKWYRKAAEADDPDAQVELGSRYELGEDVEEDYTQAAYWYRRAAEHVPDLGGAGQGRHRLGLLYANGSGVPKDFVQADMWFILAEPDPAITGVQELMTPEQISQAQQLAAEWKKQHPVPAIY